ncbi:GntP family permease [Clostridium bovifaecis]|uniref:GntP family permease n=1 Tax=Clostridium bovifaecis TaxID=2184719 RepID=A0A6I6EQJ2_9CLOT|nr:GntP family permease [Clostridium bovifaecis]
MSSTLLIINLIIAIAIIILGIVAVKMNPAIAMVIASVYMAVSCGFSWAEAANLVGKGFGDMMVSIGLPIGFGVIMGQLMSDTGAANVIAETIVKKFKNEKAIIAVGAAGFILSIPVFFDVTFVILIPIGIAIARQINKPICFVTGALSAGAAIAHGLVPPTPNPLAAGDLFGFNVGVMIIAGLVIGALAYIGTITVYTRILGKQGFWKNEQDVNHSSTVVEELSKDKPINPKGRPAFWVSMLPIIVPVICILTGTVGEAMYGKDNVPQIAVFLGNKLIAILLGTLAAYAMSYKYLGKKGVDESANEGLKTAGIVLLVTGAGGSFGAVIKATNIGATLIEAMGINTNNVIMVLLFAYFIGFIFRVVQGSGTVAGITSMTIMATIAPTVPVHPVYIALACLAGGNSVGHVNDSGFWVATNLSGLTVTGGLKTYTLPIFITTVFIMIFTMIGALVLPMV